MVDTTRPELTRRHAGEDTQPTSLSWVRTVSIVSCITCICCIGNLLAGLLTICTPIVASDLHMPSSIQLWPAAAFALACGCTLLPCGAIADYLGHRESCLCGALLQTASAVGAGLADRPSILIAWRAVAGLSSSMCLPGAVGIATNAFPAATSPRRRSVAFAAMGSGQAIGFGLGLVLGGVCAEKISWRWGFFSAAILNAIVLFLSLWALPRKPRRETLVSALVSSARNIDWIGALLVSSAFGLLSYGLAAAANSDVSSAMRDPINPISLAAGLALLPISGCWMEWRTRHHQKALVPTNIWKNLPFTTMSVSVFLVWGSLNASEQLTALYMQDIRGQSVLTTSLYFLPAPVCGILTNVAIGWLLPRLRPSVAVPVGCLISGCAPLLLATLSQIDGPEYWHAAFEAIALNPIGADVMYTIANLVVTDAFPPEAQALAGGTFNMLAQIGKSIGIATTVVIAQQVNGQSMSLTPKEALLRGYQMGWFYNCAMSLSAVAVSFWGLRSIKRLEVKRD